MRPVFIGGCGRSGTTMLGSLLGAHSACIVTPESQFKIHYLRVLSDGGESAGTRAVEAIRAHPRFRLWDVKVKPEELSTYAGGAASLMYWIVQKYAESRGKPEAFIWIDHSGANLRYAPRLLRHFPDARFIHLVRDGRAVASSVIPLDWGPNTIQRAAHWWTEHISYGLASEGYLRERALRVSFEDLVISPEKTLHRLCQFVDLPHESRMWLADGFHVPAFTRAQHRLVGEAPDPRRVDGWKKELSSRQVEIFENRTGDLLEALGYELQYGLSSAPVRWSEWAHAHTIEAIRGLVINRILHKNRMHSSLPH